MPKAKEPKAFSIRHSSVGIRHSSFDIGAFASCAHVDARGAGAVLRRRGLRLGDELVSAFIHAVVTPCLLIGPGDRSNARFPICNCRVRVAQPENLAWTRI